MLTGEFDADVAAFVDYQGHCAAVLVVDAPVRGPFFGESASLKIVTVDSVVVLCYYQLS